MVKPVEFHPDALGDGEDAIAWYREKNELIALQFAQEVEQAITRIAEAPHRWPPYFHETRRVRLNRFPFLIVYREDPMRILILAIAHAKRKPGYWKER